MRILVAIIVLVVLALAFFVFTSRESQIDRRAWLTTSKVALKNADIEFRKFGAFTNYPPTSKYVRVYSYTNHFTVDGADYQCELAADCERLTNRGFLTITTNQIFVWVDTQGSLTPLIQPDIRPSGF
jgi:hypothetical protein